MIYSPKSDAIMKELFRNQTVLLYFVSDVLQLPLEEIHSLRPLNTFLWRRFQREKLGILDVLAELNDSTKINIELQVKVFHHWDRRQIFYLAKLYTSELLMGQDYSRLHRCVGISLLNFNLTEQEEYHSIYRLKDQHGNEFTDVLEIHVIELKKQLSGRRVVDDWIRFFNAKTEEDLEMIKTENIGIQEAIRELRRMSLSNPIRVLYEGYQKKRRDEIARENYVREEGIAKGRAEGKIEGKAEGKIEGKAEGKAEGRAEGKAEGWKKGQEALLEKMLRDGELTKEQYQKLKCQVLEDGEPLGR